MPPHSKRISAGPGPDIYTATFEPTDHQWQTLEDALNTKRNPNKTLSFDFPRRLASLCRLSACSLPFLEPEPPYRYMQLF